MHSLFLKAASLDVETAKHPASCYAESSRQIQNLLPTITNTPAVTSAPAEGAMLQQCQELPGRLDEVSAMLDERLMKLRRGRELWDSVVEREKVLHSWLGLSKMNLDEISSTMDDSERDDAKIKLQQYKVKLLLS